MQVKTKYDLGMMVLMRSSQEKFYVRNISVFTDGHISTPKTQIVYELQEAGSNKRMIAKESQLNEI